MEKGKGKKPVKECDKVQNGLQREANKSDGNKSLLGRIAASATGLTQSAFAAPSHQELSDGTALALANSGKPETSHASSSSTYAEGFNLSHNNQQQETSSTSRFRTTHQDQHVEQSEAEFSSFLDGIPRELPSLDASEWLPDPVTWGEAWARSQYYEEGILSTVSEYHKTVEEQEVTDGADVLDLLGSSDLTSKTQINPSDQDIGQNYDWGLSDGQIVLIRGITRELFPDPQQAHPSMPADHPLNLIPQGESTDGNMGSPAKEGGYDEMYVQYEQDGHAVSSTQVWKTQWEGVLGRYTDEVWGDLLPLVQEVRKEVENFVDGEEKEEPVALRRLKGILGHLQSR
ncbi:hypothetical protein BJ878DRAFT_61096 [Calycina marina]|uniref:Uncharacterized protein n=1 Tax=Calycina marina TaxID=1763456 RepID=A0A9P8CEZ0_9HELO|nr:hypothetical protein BJ878DRAFT_61096 [Calycina marina]